MIGNVFKKVFGTRNERELKRIIPTVDKINALESKMESRSDEDFPKLTEEFKERIRGGESLDSILPEAFAAVREVAKRKLKMRHFDVQLVGGVILHEGKIAEMKTGEGKTLVATLPLYLNTLGGQGAHLVTVNDYLAKRDSTWMGPVYYALGLSVGVIQHDVSFIFDPSFDDEKSGHYHLRPVSRKEAYSADITYGTNNEYGFDYLRDNMKFSLEDYVQRELNFAIVDEVDSILIDEARTPLIISGPTEDSTDKYYTIDRIIPGLKEEEHYTIDEKLKQSYLTDEGVGKVEELLKIDNLYDPKHIETLHHVTQALRAHAIFKIDVDYVVKEGHVIIVDEHTGRLMDGRRWSDGLHQAVEAKEGVEIENENQTLASITFQNYFRMYNKLSGMTGTADTEAGEFHSIYGLEVAVIPTNIPLKRLDHTDLIYRTKKEKFKAVMEEIKEWSLQGRPVLVGTISIDDSEKLSKYLKSNGIKHNVLNAKFHEKEADIVAQAGSIGAVTLSTNMAGRGTDILLGGNPVFMAKQKVGEDETTDEYKNAFKIAEEKCGTEKQKVLDMGGLHIIGTERHESRRIDNQLRGRAGRQGDPGSSRFYLSLEDDLLRIFVKELVAKIMDKLGMEEGVPIEHSMVSKAIANAQKKVEAHNFDSRKHLLEFDDVMNKQRTVIYDYRRQMLGEGELRQLVQDFSEEVSEETVLSYINEKDHPEKWDRDALNEGISQQFGITLDASVYEKAGDVRGLVELLEKAVTKRYELRVEEIGEDVTGQLEKFMLLHTLDNLWKDHLLSMDHLKSGIGLRGYGQKNPLKEYEKEGYGIFLEMLHRLKGESIEKLFKVKVEKPEEVQGLEEEGKKEQKMTLGRGALSGGLPSAQGGAQGEADRQAPVRRSGSKVGRNDPCPCGSGKKYKKCCGK